MGPWRAERPVQPGAAGHAAAPVHRKEHPLESLSKRPLEEDRRVTAIALGQEGPKRAEAALGDPANPGQQDVGEGVVLQQAHGLGEPREVLG